MAAATFERAPPPAAAWLPATAWCVASLVTLERQERSGQSSHLLLQPGVPLKHSLILLLEEQNLLLLLAIRPCRAGVLLLQGLNLLFQIAIGLQHTLILVLGRLGPRATADTAGQASPTSPSSRATAATRSLECHAPLRKGGGRDGIQPTRLASISIALLVPQLPWLSFVFQV